MRCTADILIVGTGAGGATLARELARRGQKVTVVERGFFPAPLGSLRSALTRNYDKCTLRTSQEGVVVYRSLIAGGTTVISCGNGVRTLENELLGLGVDISNELEETEKDLNVRPLAEKCIGPGANLIRDKADALGLEMVPMPKFIDPDKCVSCGKCVLGCKYGAKWSALDFLNDAIRMGVTFVPNLEVYSVVSHRGRAVGVLALGERGKVRIFAKKVIISAGGVGSPAILQRSGISEAGLKLFVDLFNVTYGVHDDKMDLYKNPNMPLVSIKFKKEKGFVMAPYLDPALSLKWVMPKSKVLKKIGYRNLLGIMVKIKDDNRGYVDSREKIRKAPTLSDIKKLKEGPEVSAKILTACGVKEKNIIPTSVRSAHPGGSCAIGTVVDKNFETRIKGLYVCDASILPEAPGAPPILTIISLAKKLAGILIPKR